VSGVKVRIAISRLRTWFSRHVRDIGVAAILLGISVWMIIDAANPKSDNFRQGLDFGLAGNFIGALVILYFAEPLIRQARDAQTEVVPGVDLTGMIASIVKSRQPVRVLEISTYLLADQHRFEFLKAVRTAVARGVQVQILILDPETDSAVQRDRELVDIDLLGLIRSNLLHLWQLSQEPDMTKWPDVFAVRLYSNLPGLQIYQSEQRAHIALFIPGMRSDRAPQLVTKLATTLGGYAGEYFDDVWNADSTFTLDGYWKVGVTLDDPAAGSAAAERYQACYVIIDGTTYLSHPKLDDNLDGFDDVVSAYFDGPRAARVELRRVRADELPEEVNLISKQKYGSELIFKTCAHPLRTVER
jgi:hypothetical protein